MNFRYALFIILVCFCDNFVSAQVTFSKSISIPETNDYAKDIYEFDGHYYTTSMTLCFNNNVINNCFYFIKTDLEGNVIWQKKFEDLDTRLDDPGAFIINYLANNTFLLTAVVAIDDTQYTPFLMNINTDGDTLWTKKLENEFWEAIWDAEILPSGNLITFGTARDGNGSVDLMVRQISPEGEEIFKNRIITDCNAELPNNLTWTDDGHLLIGHYCRTGLSNYYPMVTKIDTSGNEIWTEYWEDLTTDFDFDIKKGMVQLLPNGGYAYPWATPPNNFTYVTTIMGFDSTHQPIWELPLPQINNDTQTELYYVNQTANGDLIWTGSLLGYNGISKYINCIGRVSPTGESKWIRYYIHEDRPWDFFNKLYYITETSDGGLLATGLRTDKYESDTTQTESNIWLFKVDGDGCMTPGCTDETIYLMNDTAFVDTQEALFNKETHFLLSPNPANFETQVKFVTSASTKNKTLKVFSINGQLMQQIELDGSDQTVEVDLVDFPSGIYIVALEEDGQVLQRERLIKR